MTNACSWEKLTVKEIPQAFDRVRKNYPNINENFQHLGGVAARTLVRGLQAYGWTGPELSRGGSRLMNLIGKHIDLEQLQVGQIVPLSKVLLSTSAQSHLETAERSDTAALRKFACIHLSLR